MEASQGPSTTIAETQNSAINVSQKSDVVQVLTHMKPVGEPQISCRKAGGNHTVAQLQVATFEAVKLIMEAIVFTKTSSQIICDENCSMVDAAWKVAIHTPDRCRESAGHPVRIPFVCQLPYGTSIQRNQQTRDAVNEYSAICSVNRPMMILNLQQ